MAKFVLGITAIILMILLHNSRVSSSLISQSSISQCEDGNGKNPRQKDGSPCKNQVLVSITLRGDQGETESIYADIDQVYNEGEEELSRLRKPFRIEISKSKVVASYNVHYIGAANARPSEVSFKKQRCNDNWHASNTSLACGKQIGADGEPIWDSQGFCCRCLEFFKDKQRRGDFTCSTFIAGTNRWASAHCLSHNDLWYNVFNIDPPIMQYQITLRVLEFQGIVRNESDKSLQADWKHTSTIYLGPIQPIARSVDGRVVAEIQGDLVGAQGPQDFSYKNLLIPSIQKWKNKPLPVQYTNGQSDWLVVDKNFVDLRGISCGKVGVSYTGFREQPGKCNRLQNSCFTNQPLDFWEHDDILRQQNKTGQYLISNYGKIDESTSPNENSFILRLIHEHFHNTFVTLRLDASSIVFVYNVGSGRIVDIRAKDFEALAETGEIEVDVENTGEVTAQFTISVLKCTTGVHSISAKSTTLDPGVTTTVLFQVQSFRSASIQHECRIELFDSAYNLLQTGTVNFATNSTCFCFGTCGCTCDNANGTAPCPEPPPVIIRSSLALRIFFLILEAIGLHGIVGLVCGTFIILGFLKLTFGRVLFCRKSRAQETAEELTKQGIIDKSTPLSVVCSTNCHGARAAKERYKRKVLRLRELGKKPNKLEDWRNYSYICSCQYDASDIRFIEVLKSIFFIYYIFMFPCVWVGKKVVWGILRDTQAQKKKAIDSVLRSAKKKGKLGKYDASVQSEEDDLKKENKDDEKTHEQSTEKKGLKRKQMTDDSAIKDMQVKNEKNEKKKQTQEKKSKKRSNGRKLSEQLRKNMESSASSDSNEDTSARQHLLPHKSSSHRTNGSINNFLIKQ